MVGRRLGRARRRVGLAVTAAGALLVMVAAYGIVGSGDVGHELVSTFTALPTGVLLLLAGLDLLTRPACGSGSSWPAVSMDEWLATAQSRRQAAKATSS